jgi:hypothetical protein
MLLTTKLNLGVVLLPVNVRKRLLVEVNFSKSPQDFVYSK